MEPVDTLRARAVDLHRAGKRAEALGAYTAYLARVPDDGAMWSNLGALFRTEGRHDAALRAQERAFALQPDSLSVINNLANILNDIGQHDRSVALRRQALARDPGDANQKAMIGKALRASGRYADAIAHLAPAAAQHPDFAELRIQLALAQLADRDYVAGFDTYRARWETGELTPRKMTVREWDGGPLDGKRIAILPEQGFGDAITFARFAPALRRFNPAQVLMLTEKPLSRVLSDVAGVDRADPQIAESQIDCWVNMMDLPLHHFRADPAVPAPTRLHVPADSVDRARAIVAPHRNRFRVGVVWTGSMTYRANAFRSFHHSDLLPLVDVPGVQLFSLYKGPGLAEFQADGTGAFILDAASGDRDFADCAAMMRELDLVITSCTVTAHLAGSLGVPVWTLLHWDAFWLWQHTGDRTDWYPSMHLIRQDRPRDWAGVMARVKDRLSQTVAERRAA